MPFGKCPGSGGTAVSCLDRSLHGRYYIRNYSAPYFHCSIFQGHHSTIRAIFDVKAVDELIILFWNIGWFLMPVLCIIFCLNLVAILKKVKHDEPTRKNTFWLTASSFTLIMWSIVVLASAGLLYEEGWKRPKSSKFPVKLLVFGWNSPCHCRFLEKYGGLPPDFWLRGHFFSEILIISAKFEIYQRFQDYISEIPNISTFRQNPANFARQPTDTSHKKNLP